MAAFGRSLTVQNQIIGALRVGATEKHACQLLGIAPQSLWEFKKRHNDFALAVKDAKELVDDKVVKRLYDRAMEGEFAAIRFWLMNRKREEWSGRQDIANMGDVTVTVRREPLAHKKAFDRVDELSP